LDRYGLNTLIFFQNGVILRDDTEEKKINYEIG